MLTRNFYALQAVETFQAGVFTGVAVDVNGNNIDLAYYRSGANYCNLPLGQASIVKSLTYGIVLGSGSTPATIDDFRVQNPITTGFSNTTVKTFTRTSANGAEIVYQTVLTNTSSGPISIAEIGSVGIAYQASTGGAVGYFLVDRTVLDTPIVIPAGESKTLEYTIRLNFPT